MIRNKRSGYLRAVVALMCCLVLGGCGGDSLDYVPLTVTTRNSQQGSPSETDEQKASGTVTTAPETGTTASQTTTSNENEPDEDENTNEENSLSDSEYLENALFIGDSICSGLSSYLDEYSDGKNVLSYRDGRTGSMFNVNYQVDGKEYSLDEAYAEIDPDYVYFWLGTNEIATLSPEKFSQGLEELVNEVMGEDAKEKKIGLVSMAPVGRSYKITPDEVNAYNEAMKALAEKMGGNVTYIDIHSAVCASDGYLSSEYDSGDGLHITNKGYRAISEALLNAKMQ